MVNNISKYLRITAILIRNCFSKETAYRLSFSIWVVANILWFAVSFLSINLLFGQIPVIAGWSANEARLLVVVHAIFLTIIWMFVMPNLTVFWRLINQGTLDFHLTKPISARFLSSATFFEFDMIPRFIPAALILLYLLKAFPKPVTLETWLFFFVALISGAIIFYNFGFMIATTCFWFTKIDALEDLFNGSLSIGKYPADIFKGTPKAFFSYIIPTIFIATFPTLILLGRDTSNIVVACLVGIIISSVASQWFWNFALRHYSSASS